MASRKSTVTETENLPTSLQEAVDRLADPKATLVAIIDRAVKEARAANWCDTFETIMERAAPELAVATAYDRRTGRAGKTFVDSNGGSCNGYDLEGYAVTTGLHYQTKLDRDGYDRYGFHSKTGLDRDGFNANGDNPANPAAAYRFTFTNGNRYYLTDWDGYSPDGSPAYDANGNYLTRRQLNILRARLGAEGFNLDRNGNPAPAEAPASS